MAIVPAFDDRKSADVGAKSGRSLGNSATGREGACSGPQIPRSDWCVVFLKPQKEAIVIGEFRHCLAACLLFHALCAQGATAREEPLLAFSRGQNFNDVGSDSEQTTCEIVDFPELPGKSCRVTFADRDSVGVRAAPVKNWSRCVALKFDVFHPGTEPCPLTLAIVHSQTTGYPTRADVPLMVKSGKNSYRLSIDKITNTNGSRPDLSEVRRFFLACDGVGTTLYFGDFSLELPGDTVPSARPPLVSDPDRIQRLRRTKMPAITKPVPFHTPAADAIAAALEVFPPDNPWNAVVTRWPVHPNSRNLVASVGADKPFRCNFDMGYIFVPPDQPRVKVNIIDSPAESDPGPYPVPDNVPIEGWPRHPAGSSLLQVQRRPEKYEADRHAIVIDPVNRVLYEFFTMGRTDQGWAADQASVFDLKSNKLRPDGWTSSDAAGLPIFPAIVRYDELQRGEIEHALRVTIRKSRRAYVPPATHYASPHTDENLPRMGERFRLRASFDVTGFSRDAQTILKALKKYGMFVADNGLEWAVSIAPDPRIPDISAELRKVKGSDFEVVTPE
jgi:hypothetical protein